MEINSAAPVITRDEILIHAPIETIWDSQTNVVDWPSWQPDVDGAELDGPLAYRIGVQAEHMDDPVQVDDAFRVAPPDTLGGVTRS
jgi:hypothetical protein